MHLTSGFEHLLDVVSAAVSEEAKGEGVGEGSAFGDAVTEGEEPPSAGAEGAVCFGTAVMIGSLRSDDVESGATTAGVLSTVGDEVAAGALDAEATSPVVVTGATTCSSLVRASGHVQPGSRIITAIAMSIHLRTDTPSLMADRVLSQGRSL